MKKNEPIPPPKENGHRLVERMASLEDTIEELREQNETLKTEREQLLEENRSLRREITQMRLLRDMEGSIDDIEEETGRLPARPPAADDLYALLPPSFAFPVFFKIAESKGFGTDEARRCLLYYLSEDLVVQKGSRLVKQRKPFGDGDE